MDRRTLVAVILCFLIFLGWQKYYIEPRNQIAQQQAFTSAPPEATAPGAAPGQSSPSATTATAPLTATRSEALATGTGEALVGDGAQFFSGWSLKSYKLGLTPEASAVDLQSVTHQSGGAIEFAVDDKRFAYLSNVRGVLSRTPQGVTWTFEDDAVRLTREFTASEGMPYVDLRITAQFKKDRPAFAFVTLGQKAANEDADARDRQISYWSGDSIHRLAMKDFDQVREVSTPVKFAAATNRYFLMALVNPAGGESKGLQLPNGEGAGKFSLVYPLSSNQAVIPMRVYFGPKDLALLRAVEPTLDHTVDFGMFTIIAYPILRLMRWFHGFFGNYGVSIILVTLLLKVVTYPLTYKSMKSMKEMARLQPQLAKLREKYKDDKESLNREMLTLMRSHGYNPMAGCLPILIQMPVFFALYQVLYSSIELYHAPFALWIHDLSTHDRFYVTPVLLTLTMFIQQRLTPNTSMDPAQQKMLQIMPIIFGGMMLWLPSGLTLYMLVNALASIIQQIILNKKFNVGNPAAAVAGAR
jgi:YidC/Oxa1 family membrane protein insertase